MSSSRRLVVVGNGMVSVALLERLVRQDGGWRITVLGDEPSPAYDRIGLSQVLAGERTARELPLHDRDWYAGHGIELQPPSRHDASSFGSQSVIHRRPGLGADSWAAAYEDLSAGRSPAAHRWSSGATREGAQAENDAAAEDVDRRLWKQWLHTTTPSI